MTRAAVLAPGYGSSATQPLLVALVKALAGYGIDGLPITFTHKRPSPDYTVELDDLRRARDQLRATHRKVALVGRSFGGRMCTRLASLEPPDALAVVGHPIAPPDRPRPDDERALGATACPTLIVQGSDDELGPLAVLERIAGTNPRIDLIVLAGARHSLRPKQEREAALHVARWLDATLR